MKKIIMFFICLILSLSLVACKNEEKIKHENILNTSENITTENISKTNATSTLSIDEDIGGGEIVQQKYRSIYYCIPAPFWDIVDENSRENIYGDYWKIPDNETNIMRMRVFVEEFHVSRDEFDAANAEWARIVKENLYGTPVINPKDYINQEFDEIYNADIIYSFDNELINEYYLSHDYPYCYESEYEKAVEDGLYDTQTMDIIDLAALEEELELFNRLKIQKEAHNKEEIITETTVYEETTALILDETKIEVS